MLDSWTSRSKIWDVAGERCRGEEERMAPALRVGECEKGLLPRRGDEATAWDMADWRGGEVVPVLRVVLVSLLGESLVELASCWLPMPPLMGAGGGFLVEVWVVDAVLSKSTGPSPSTTGRALMLIEKPVGSLILSECACYLDLAGYSCLCNVLVILASRKTEMTRLRRGTEVYMEGFSRALSRQRIDGEYVLNRRGSNKYTVRG